MNKLSEKVTELYLKVTYGVKSFISEEKGASDILAMIIIIGVVLTIGFIFKKQIEALVKLLWDSLVSKKNGVNRDGIGNWNG